MRASPTGLRRIETALKSVRDQSGDLYEKGKESNAIPAARLYRFQQTPEIQNQAWTSESQLTFKLVNENLVKPGYLSKNPIDESGKITVADIEQLILDGELSVPSIYGKTWQGFYQGKDINENAFKAYCVILQLNWRQIADSEVDEVWKRLEFCLWEFNHRSQITLFNQLVKRTGNVAGFRIKRESNATTIYPEQISLNWLLKCLIKPIDGENSLKIVSVDLSSPAYNEFDKLLEFIAWQLDLSSRKRNLIKTVSQEICKKLEKESSDILLILENVDCRDKVYLDQIIQDFWKPLIAKYSQLQGTKKLIMCWSDPQNNLNIDWRRHYKFPTKLEDSWHPDQIVDINLEKKFKQSNIESWLDHHQVCSLLADINPELIASDAEIQNTLTKWWIDSLAGQPEHFLKAVYTSCNLKWETYKNRWLEIK